MPVDQVASERGGVDANLAKQLKTKLGIAADAPGDATLFRESSVFNAPLCFISRSAGELSLPLGRVA